MRLVRHGRDTLCHRWKSIGSIIKTDEFNVLIPGRAIGIYPSFPQAYPTDVFADRVAKDVVSTLQIGTVVVEGDPSDPSDELGSHGASSSAVGAEASLPLSEVVGTLGSFREGSC